ncbi:hypothetical protein EHQ68_01565 [Leptospira congkakensis]|uniref:Uncharacterized protein n=1 Tax=Leptospira congkakensis TaxID=2484932 RepID=A0A4Z1A5G8_9LEPT|nr:hypothetical protein [Leptospira congkakensis]TGL90146.1 hypothetical protein EHQ69_09330 [Leptospira congkakensis]TGL91995.1 hypothetical protein EHQ68_01565 [Leptospira congkakensis]TGL98204.1 hypothetical protein EHQ70_01155 [Leptospira congkakensis]
MKRFFILLTIFFFTFTVFASEKELKSIPKSKTAKVLKSVAYATIRSTLLVSYADGVEKQSTYTPCSDNFPSMPGDFPCNYLDYEGTTLEVAPNSAVNEGEATEGSDPEDVYPGGKVTIKQIKQKSPNLNGKVVLLGEGEDQLKLFYGPKGQISHYIFRQTLVIFKWDVSRSEPSLIGLLFVNVNRDYFPQDVKEYSF